MKRLIASFAALSLLVVPAVAATSTAKPKPAAAKSQRGKPAANTNTPAESSNKST